MVLYLDYKSEVEYIFIISGLISTVLHLICRVAVFCGSLYCKQLEFLIINIS